MGLMSDYRLPPSSASEDTRAGHCRELLQQGENWLRQQRAYTSIQSSRDLILGSSGSLNIPTDQSKVRIPRTKREIREIISILANLRPTASNKSENKAYEQHANIFNKLDKHWWYNTFADRTFRKGFQAAAMTGTVYLSHVWDMNMRGFGKGDIRTDVYGADNVLLINPPADFDLQKCYAVVIKKRVPIHLVHARYPMRAHEIMPDHGVQAWTQQGLDFVQQFVSSPLKALNGAGTDDARLEDVFPTVDIYEWTIYDLSLNMTGHPVRMGDPGTSWDYEVPAYGSQIKTGTNSWEGVPLYRRALVDDARLYPLRRRIEMTSTKILYDNTQEAWHGRVPLARFSFDDWYGEALGFPLSHDTESIEEDSTRLLRGISDAASVKLDPPLQYDENLVSDRLAQQLNPRRPGERLKGNMQMGDMIKALLPANYADLPAYIPELVKFLAEQQDWVIGVGDLKAITKARQIPSSDSIEKIMEMSGPLAQDMTRCMEQGMRDLGDLRRWLWIQFCTTKRRLQILGDDGVTEQDFDFDPGTMVPSHMADEDPQQPSRFSMVDRAKEIANQTSYHVVPHSMARVHQSSQRLMLLQLAKSGAVPIDPWTMAELFEVDNFGTPPEGTETIMQRWVAWQHIQRELAEEMSAGQAQGKQKGRPPSGTHAPQIKSKDGGTRSTVTQSR